MIINNGYFVYCRSPQSSQCKLTNDQIRRFGLYLSSSNRTHPSIVKPLDVDMILPRMSKTGANRHECTFSNYVPNDATLNEQALCPWKWHINFNKLRIPQSLVEATCKCDKIRETIIGVSNTPLVRYLECEPVYYSIRVFLFDETCNEYRETVEELPLACIPINKSGNQMIRGDYATERFISDV